MLIYMIMVVKVSDIGAYFVGCRYGRHKLFPRVSPAKSWEGTLGGLLSAVAMSVAIFFIFGGTLGPVRLRLTDAIILGVLLAVCGIFGDLLESLMKRAAGLKDSGTLIAGMGGVLDVIDSLLPAAPALYFYARFFLAPAT
jgi:phosphatidate cytidylyltransferase